MAKITICFILDNGAYREIPYSEIFFKRSAIRSMRADIFCRFMAT